MPAVIVALVAAYAAAGFWVVPRLVEARLGPWLQAQHGVQLNLRNVRFNPFTFAASAEAVSVAGSDGGVLMKVDHVAANYAPSALRHRTWRLERLAITGLDLDLALSKSGELNLQALLQRLLPNNTTSAEAPARVVIDELRLDGARVTFTDLHGPAPATATIAPITFEMTGLSTLPGAHATHRLEATLPYGARLAASGDVVLQPALQANGQVELTALGAERWLPFLRRVLRIGKLEGHIDLSSRYAYAAAPGLRLDGLDLQVADLLLAAPDTLAPLLALKQLDVAGGHVDLNARDASLASLALTDGRASLAVAPDGSNGWTRLAPPAPNAQPAVREPDGADWHLAVAALTLSAVGLDYDDRRQQPPLVARVGGLDGRLRLALTAGAHTSVEADEMALEAQAIALPAPHAGGPTLQLDSASVQGGAFDLAGRRVAAQQVSIRGGSAAIARNADGSIDWLRRFAPPRAAGVVTADAAAAWQVDIGRIGIDGIDLALVDRTQAPAFSYAVRVASATVQDIATDATAPMHFEAKVVAQRGGTLQTQGSVESDGTGLQASLQIDALALAPFRPLARHYTGFDLSGGPLTLAANVRNAQGLAVDHLRLDLPGLTLRARAGAEPLFSAATVQVRDARVALAKRRVDIGAVTAADGVLRARLLPGGRIDWQGSGSGAASGPPRQPTPASEAWALGIDALKLRTMAAHYTDATGNAPLQLDVGAIGLTTALQVAAGGAEPQAVVQGLQLKLRQVELATARGAAPAVRIDTATLADGHLDLAQRQVGATRLILDGGVARIARDGAGRIDLLEALAAWGADRAAASPTTAPAQAPWQYAVEQVEVHRFSVDAEDGGYVPPLALAGQIDATLGHVASTGEASFDATIAMAEDAGSIKATGTRAAASGNVKARVVVDDVLLIPLQPLIGRYTRLALSAGKGEGDLAVSYAPAASQPLQATGRFGLQDLMLSEAESGAHVLSFARLDARRLDFASGDRQLRIDEVAVVRPDMRIAIAKDRSVNLGELLRKGADAPVEAPAKTADETAAGSAEAPSTEGAAPAFDVSVRRIRVRDGSVDFSDQSLVLPFATQVRAIEATIAGVSSVPTRRAEVQARGSIEPYGSASATGSIVPFDPSRYTDLHVKFNNVLMQPFTPYTATFAGRRVESGKLWLDLDYKIDHGDLLGKNNVRLADFRLGERVASKNAIDLPIDLAVSLLTDADREIHLALPVRGDLDNPRFEVGDAIGQALRNTLGRIVSAPFRLLGRLFGGGGKALTSIEFPPGSAELAPEQREKLDTLSRALDERPLLRLVVGAPYDAARDSAELQREAARRQVAAFLHDDAADDADAPPVAFDDPATRDALRTLAAQPPAPGDASTAAATPADRDARASFEALFDRIARRQVLGAAAPQILATQRAAGIAAYLAQQGIDRERVQTGRVRATASDSDGSIGATLGLAAEVATR